MSSKTLGRGLSTLIPPKLIKQNLDKEISPPGEKIFEITTSSIQPNPHQPRRNFESAPLKDLANSIKIHGIIQPLIVNKVGEGYQLIAGERRWRAAKSLKLEKVPVVVRSVTNQEKLELALVENVQRQNLNPIERAYGYQRLIDEFNLTQEEVGTKVGQSRAAVANSIRLLSLPDGIQVALQAGKLTEGHAKVILSVESSTERQRLYKDILRNKLTVRRAETEARKVTVRKHTRRTVDPNIVAKEEAIQEALGTKVEIKKSGSQGTIMIHYYSSEELQEIIRKITDN